ncbi:hypothetical protein [Psychroserpens luteolus]|uniref:hypothetical protein n=1 Tax=Psychroserpens luteolus TaxID=2855840 RepID=UPI001E65A182|nr:hypothetical protein [Psychroserpens luteolus]MCD2260952.1 hypothetical protein [Psychroserpens luteolus]
MKTTIAKISLSIILLLFSCSSDDDYTNSASPPTELYVPKQIDVIYGNNNQRTCLIEYNDANQISNLNFQYNNIDDGSYNITYSNGKINQVTKGESLQYTFLYTNNILSSIQLVNSSNSNSFDITYDSDNNIYTLGSSSVFYFDSSDNLTRIVSGDIERSLSFTNPNASEGIFSTSHVPLHLIFILSSIEFETLYYLSSKQISEASVTYDGGFQNSSFYDYELDNNDKIIGFKIDNDWGTVMRTDQVSIVYQLLTTE